MPFDIPLPLTGTSGVECRTGGATSDYHVILTFPTSVTFTGAALSAGTGNVSSASGSGSTSVVVNLTGVANAQRITVTLSGVSDGANTGSIDVPMGLLLGDANGDGVVNSGDAIQVRNRSGHAADASNFRSDFNLDGSVNSGDALIVRARSGTGLP